MDGVAQFVDKYVVDKFEWQFHQGNIEADSAVAAATSPSSASMRKADFVVAKAALPGKICQAFGEVAFCLDSQRLYDDVAYAADDIGVLRRAAFGQRGNDLLAMTGNAWLRAGGLTDDERMALTYLHAVREGDVA